MVPAFVRFLLLELALGAFARTDVGSSDAGMLYPCLLSVMQPRNLSRREAVEQSLMQMLVQGRLRPGERFSELALARQHKVTTVTIREALLRLASLGVFTKVVRKQGEVTRIDAAAIKKWCVGSPIQPVLDALAALMSEAAPGVALSLGTMPGTARVRPSAPVICAIMPRARKCGSVAMSATV